MTYMVHVKPIKVKTEVNNPILWPINPSIMPTCNPPKVDRETIYYRRRE